MKQETKQSFLFICQTDNDEIRVGNQLDIDNWTTWASEANQDINFTVIAKIPESATLDFNPSQIVWYDQKEHEKAFVDKVIMSIINRIKW